MRTERRATYYVDVDRAEKAIEEIEEAFAFLEHFTRIIGSYVDYYEDRVSVVHEINDAFSLADSHYSIVIVYIYDMTPDEHDGTLVHHYELQVYVPTDDGFYYRTKIRVKANGEFTHEEEKTHGKEN